MDASSFYSTITRQKFLRDAIEQIEEVENVDGEIDIATIGPPKGGDGSDIEYIDEESLQVEENVAVPKEIACEVDVFCNVDNKVKCNEKTKSKKGKSQPRWNSRHIDANSDHVANKKDSARCKLLTVAPELAGASEWTVFIKVFADMLELLVQETNKYATRDKNKPGFNISNEEMCNFIGLLILSGYNYRTNERDYWSRAPDLSCKAVSETMSRNRYCEIKNAIHAADNQSLDSSKMAKVAPLYKILNNSLSMFGVLHEDLSIDESMVPYFGRHACKQFIKEKPIRFGYKLWIIASACGMPYKVIIYEGKPSGMNNNDPLGTRVILSCVEVCANPSLHHLYFDNFFSSYDLIVQLKGMGFRATGTVRENRTKGCPLKSVCEMKKLERGAYDHKSDGTVEVIRWKDNSVVTFISNAHSLEPLQTAKRWVKGVGHKNIPQPSVGKFYNTRMGGVDLLDRALADLRPRVRGKKWYWPLLINAVNVALVFSWRVHQLCTDGQIEQKDFRRQIVAVLLKQAQPRPRIECLPGPKGPVPLDVVKQGEHYPAGGPVRRCIVCKKSCRSHCNICEKSMHQKVCFQLFHKVDQ